MSEDAREERIRALLPIVKAIARRVHRVVPTSDVEDLIGDGCVGLIRAVDAFDPARGVPLDQYARRVILGAVLNGVRRRDPVTERMRRTIRIANRARYALAQELGTLPSLAAMERFSPRLAHARTEAHRRAPLSLDYPLPRREHLQIDRSDDPQTLIQTRADLEDLIRKLWHRLAVTVLFVTHDIEEAVYLGDRVAVITGAPGRIERSVAVDLPKPRDQVVTRQMPKFLELRYLLHQAIGQSEHA